MHQKKRALLAVTAISFWPLYASATMPNPDVKPFSSSGVVDLGVDVSPQHYGTVKIAPAGNGKFNISVTCENGEPGGTTDAIFVIEFRANDQVLRNYSQDCHLHRELFTSHQKVTTPGTIDLSDVLDKLTNVKLIGYHAPLGFHPPLIDIVPPKSDVASGQKVIDDAQSLLEQALKLPRYHLKILAVPGFDACKELTCGKVPADKVSFVLDRALDEMDKRKEEATKDWQAWAATFSSIFSLGSLIVSFASFMRAGRAERKANDTADKMDLANSRHIETPPSNQEAAIEEEG